MLSNLNPVIAQALAPFVLPPAKREPQYKAIIDASVAGIPCKIGVTYFNSVKGSFDYNAASDLDYRGYVECEYDVLDRRGRYAKWLESKLTDKDSAEIGRLVVEYFA